MIQKHTQLREQLNRTATDVLDTSKVKALKFSDTTMIYRDGILLRWLS